MKVLTVEGGGGGGVAASDTEWGFSFSSSSESRETQRDSGADESVSSSCCLAFSKGWCTGQQGFGTNLPVN